MSNPYVAYSSEFLTLRSEDDEIALVMDINVFLIFFS